YIQSAQDLAYDPANPDKFIKDREDLNRSRIAAVQKFLNAETAGTGLTYTVLVHNPADPGIPAVPVNNAVSLFYLGSPAGIVPVGVGAAGSGGAGGGGAGGGAGGAGGGTRGTTGSF